METKENQEIGDYFPWPLLSPAVAINSYYYSANTKHFTRGQAYTVCDLSGNLRANPLNFPFAL